MNDAVASKTATLRLVLPIRAWLHTPSLHRWTTVLFGVFAGYPLLAGWLISQEFEPVSINADGTFSSTAIAALSHDLKWLDWPFVAYFGAAWLVAMWLLIRPKITAMPVVVVAILALLTQGPVALWLEGTLHARTGNLLSAILAIGGSEELAKIIPLVAALILVIKVYPARQHELLDLTPRGFLYLGCVSGVVFGCSEAVVYIVSTQNSLFSGQANALSLTETVFLRLITDPINHALWAGVTGFFIGLAVQRARQLNRLSVSGLLEQSWLIGIGLAVAATLHGLHDFSGNLALEAFIDAGSALLLLGYAVAGDIVERALVSAPAPQWGSRIAGAARRATAQRPQGPSGYPPQYPPAAHYGSAPQYPAPQYPAPQYPAPQYPSAQHPSAQYPAAQYPAPQYGPPPQFPAPQQHDPRPQFGPPPVWPEPSPAWSPPAANPATHAPYAALR